MSRLIPMDPGRRSQTNRRRHHRWLPRLLFLFALLVLLTYLGVRWSGFWLVYNQPIHHVQWVAVLDGQSADLERTTAAAQMLLDGQADSVVVLGRRVFRDRNNADFYVEDMLQQGAIDQSRVFLLRHDDDSSLEEAYSLIPALKRRNADTVLLLTHPAATRRVHRIFNTLAKGSPVFLVKAIPVPTFDPRTWAQTRVSRKAWLKEWLSFLVSWVELRFAAPAEPLPGK
ncbi:MAG TPA: ElyC/SanA/YdcF family protein, partial [Fibrobacteraceae bacterium]|nr:ElyC/SanA/YdcF family protein [Fibrobacteraceae bacterium]